MLELDYKSIAQISRQYKAYHKDLSHDSKNIARYSTQFETETTNQPQFIEFVHRISYIIVKNNEISKKLAE